MLSFPEEKLRWLVNDVLRRFVGGIEVDPLLGILPYGVRVGVCIVSLYGSMSRRSSVVYIFAKTVDFTVAIRRLVLEAFHPNFDRDFQRITLSEKTDVHIQIYLSGYSND